MRNYTASLLVVLLVLLTESFSPVWAKSQVDNRILISDILSSEVDNHSLEGLSASFLDSITLAVSVISAWENKQDRELIVQGLESLDKQINQYIYPASVYQAIADEVTRAKIQQKNALKLFSSVDQSAQNIYHFDRECLNASGLRNRRLVSGPVEKKDQKLISFVIQFGGCDAIRLELFDVSNIDGRYYFSSVKASQLSDKALVESRTLNKAIAFQYEVAGLFKSGVAPAKLNGFWGLIDRQGKWLVRPQYKEIGRLSEGVIAVEKNSKFAFIHASLSSVGKLVTKFKYEKAHYFSDGLAGVKISGKWGFINHSGDLVIPAIYENIRHFYAGFAPVKLKNKWGYINKKGQWLVKPIYNAAYSFTDDRLAVVVVKNKRGFINTKGRFAIKPSYWRVQRFSEGIAPVSLKKASWYFINKENRSLFKQKFSQVRTFSEDATAVMNDEKKWGYINKNGRLVISYQFDKAYDFKDGLALVRRADKRGFINKQGDIVVPMIYDDAFRFSEGLAPVKKGKLWGYIAQP